MTALLRFLLAALFLCGPAARADDGTAIVVVAHPGVGRVDAAALLRLYTGRAIEVAGTPVTVVNLAATQPVREHFLEQVLAMDNDKYVAYWIVRRHVGKGVPPRELKSAAEVIGFVQATPGGIGYVTASDLRPGLNVIFKP